MMDALSSAEFSVASTPQQASLIALRTEAQSQKAVADLLAKQAEQQTQEVVPTGNPEGVGQNVDTFA